MRNDLLYRLNLYFNYKDNLYFSKNIGLCMLYNSLRGIEYLFVGVKD